MKIKDDNNLLKEENFQLTEKLQKKEESLRKLKNES